MPKEYVNSATKPTIFQQNVETRILSPIQTEGGYELVFGITIICIFSYEN